jgi:predicted transcriptional regulator
MGKLIWEQKGSIIKTDSKTLVDGETGELFDVEDSTVYANKFTGKIKIDYADFVMVEIIQLKILMRLGAKQEDIALLTILATQIEIGTNICLSELGKPHDTKSIAYLCNCTVQSAKRKLNRLIKLGAMAHDKFNTMKKVYAINPHVVKKGKDTMPIVVSKFKELNLDFDISDVKEFN